MKIFGFLSKPALIFAAMIAGSANGAASAQTVGSLPLPPGQIISDPVAYGPGQWQKNCPMPNGPNCKSVTYPSIFNGHDADQYLQPYLYPAQGTEPFINSQSAPVAVVWTSAPTQYVRFYTGTSAAGPWVVPTNVVRGLTPQQVRDVLALPAVPTMQTIVQLPVGTCMIMGAAGPIVNAIPGPGSSSSPGFWGNGGGMQGFLIGKSNSGCGDANSLSFAGQFINQQSLWPFALAYGQRAGGGNPGAVAFALDHAIFPAQFTDMDRVYNALDLLNYGEPGPLRYALAQLDGEVYANVASVVIGAGRMFVEVLRDQTHLARVPTVQRLRNGWRPWISGFGGAASLYGNQDFKGVSFSGGGVAVGADYLYSPALQFGLSAAYSGNAFGMNGISGSGNLDSYSFGSYAGYASGNVYLDAAVGYSYNQAGASRSIAFPGVARVATASLKNDSLLSRAEIGYNFFLSDRTKTTPFASFQGIVVFPRGFSEQGAGAVSLNVNERTVTTATSTLGAELSYDLPVGLHAPLTLSGRAGWAHDYADIKRQVLQNFQGALRSNFWVEGAHWPRNAASIGAKITLPLTEANLFIRYDGMFSNNADISSATGGVSINF